MQTLTSPPLLCCLQSRLQRELWQLLQYGSAQPALQLLWRFDLLQALLPPVNTYIAECKVARCVQHKPRTHGIKTCMFMQLS
jgi:tRNA nucleotidyltransferase/poly(A) polymerase